MERQIITVSQDRQFVLSDEAKSALELQPGSQWELCLHDRRVVLQPIEPDPITALRGMFGPGSNLEDTLMEMRRAEKW